MVTGEVCTGRGYRGGMYRAWLQGSYVQGVVRGAVCTGRG